MFEVMDSLLGDFDAKPLFEMMDSLLSDFDTKQLLIVAAVVMLIVGKLFLRYWKPNVNKLKDKSLIWSWALHAVLNEQNQVSNYVYGGVNKNKLAVNPKQYKNLLATWWNINNREESLSAIDALSKAELHHPEFMGQLQPLFDSGEAVHFDNKAVLNEVTKHGEHIQQYGFVGWDYVRAQGVIAWAYHADYLSLEEARGYALVAAKKVQDTFPSWEVMAQNYALGFYCWSQDDKEYKAMKKAIKQLLSRRSSPWVVLDWNLTLV